MDKLLSIEELSQLLGVEISTIYSWTHRKAIPFIKLGKLVRFQQCEVMAWLQSKTISPSQLPPHTPKLAPAKKRVPTKSVTADYVDRLVKNAQKEVGIQ